jgi:hypothetical protein
MAAYGRKLPLAFGLSEGPLFTRKQSLAEYEFQRCGGLQTARNGSWKSIDRASVVDQEESRCVVV